MSTPIVRTILAFGWLAGVLAISVGSAGIVAAISHQPGTAAREELTWAADEAIRPGLASAVDDLAAIGAEVDALGRAGRGALAALAARDEKALDYAIEDGTARVRRVDAMAVELRSTLARLPGIGPGDAGRLGWGVRSEYARIGETVDLTKGLRGQWAILTAGSAAARQLATLLAVHDDYVARGVRLGNAGQYARAFTSVKRGSVRLDAARQLRDVLANSADVSTLDVWIARNGAIDKGLRDLYAALVKSNGRTTALVEKRLRAVQAAQAALPPDTRGLVIIMGDLARGGLNQAVIEIERASEGLGDAVRAIRSTAASAPAPAD